MPLQIFNLETGYHIEYILDRFTHNYNTMVTLWESKHKFTELEPVNINQENSWKKNREKVYNVSIVYFIKSLYKNSLKNNGFVLFNFIEPDDKPSQNNVSIPSMQNILIGSLDPQGIQSRMNNIKIKDRFQEIPNSNLDKFLSIDSVNGSKTLFLPSDSSILLVCYGMPIIEENLLNALSKQNKKNRSEPLNIARNKIETPAGPVQIFPDGTFKNILQLSPKFSNKFLTGLNMQLPINYTPHIYP